MRWAAFSIVAGFGIGVLAAQPLLSAAGFWPADEGTKRITSAGPRPLYETSAVPSPIGPSQLLAFGPLPERYERKDAGTTQEEIELGRMLFFDERLSRNHDISCNSCHPLDRFGMDGAGVSTGHLGQQGRRNAPTVYNAAGSRSQFWDGRADSVEQQAMMPVLDPFEMAMSEPRVVQTLRSISEYVERFEAIFPNQQDPVTMQNLGYVIGAFERGLVTPSRWDRFVGGDEDALDTREQQGFSLFLQLGCPNCHSGPLIGDGHFEVLGQIRPWPNQADLGRNEVFKSWRGVPMFKVPSLRNVAKTAPYFHDASADTLEEAIRLMAEHQLGTKVSDEGISLIATWLSSLTGALPERYIQPPDLPESTDATPKPERNGY